LAFPLRPHQLLWRGRPSGISLSFLIFSRVQFSRCAVAFLVPFWSVFGAFLF
jgi:hypothetical protein